MSRTLAQLLGKPEQMVSAAISKLEELAGLPSEDLRLLSENRRITKKKTAQLGLDPEDTTGEELYHSSLLRYRNDSRRIDKAIGITSESTFDEKLNKAISLVSHAIGHREVWTVKARSARQLLRDCPSKRLMKQYSYRSLDSMLRREDVASLLLAAPYLESATWQNDFRKAAAKLTSTDYTMQPLSFVRLPEAKLANIDGPRTDTAISRLAGAAAVWPSRRTDKADTLSLAMMLAGGIEDLGVSFDMASFSAVHPALRWWTEAPHLLSLHGDDTVSLNLKDVALNHLKATAYPERLLEHGQRSLWQELKGRYQNYSKEITEALPEIEAGLGRQMAAGADTLLPTHLATEAVEA